MRFMHLVKPLSRIFRSAPSIPPAPENRFVAPDSGSPELIIATALGDGEEAPRAAAVRKLAQLIDAGTIDFAVLSVPKGTTPTVLAVAGLCSDPAHLIQALASIDDPQRVAKLVIEGSSSRLRQLAAQRIEDPKELKQLLKQVRGKDNGVYKIIKQKCDALRAEEQRIKQIESDVEAACASLDRHSRRPHDALYLPTFETLEARWRTLEAQAPPQVRERAALAIDLCREVIAGHLRQLAQQAVEESQRATLQAAQQRAMALADLEAQRRDEAAARAAAEAAAVREAEDKACAERLAAESLTLRQIGGLIGKANSALRDGSTGQAAGLRRAIEVKLPTLPVAPPYLIRQVQQLDAKLNELKEWKEHAVAPKRAELIEEMEALIGSAEEPKALADRIKQLQEDWKTISKGIVSDSESDWQRFHQASVAAYQPCRDYFEAQAKLRLANVEHRKGVLDRLRAFATVQSGEHPDWRAVAAVLREARQEWRRYFPVDRVAGLAVQEEFDASIGTLHGRLDAWYAQNVADRKSLILRAQHLRTKEDSREAVDAVKSLQLLWKKVGAVPHDQEQPLWGEFREHCDAVYEKRQQAYAEYTSGLEANKAQAVALCEQAEQGAALSGPLLLEGAGNIAQWRAAFEGLGEMPRADQRALHDRFERALELCRIKISQQRAQEKEQSFGHLLEAAQRIQAYGWAVAQGSAPSELTSLKQAAETFIAGVQQWPKGGAQALKDAWMKADAAADVDAAAHEIVFRTLCIRSEILTDQPTPAEDQALRRDYQVQRLMQHMGQRSEVSADALDTMAIEWVRVGPVSTAIHEPLLARFLRSRSRA